MDNKVVLGIHSGHNSTVSLLIDGKIVGAISQEKFDNHKNSRVFPIDAIKWILKEHNIEPEEVSKVAIAGIFLFNNLLFENLPKTKPKPSSFKDMILYNLEKNQSIRKKMMGLRFSQMRQATIKEKAKLFEILKGMGITAPVEFFQHHECHAAASYFTLNKDPNEKALIFTIDGAGDKYCATISKAENGKINKLSATTWDNSLGFIYSMTTEYLGMRALEHEYKVMGLAPYAKNYYLKTYDELFKGMISFDPDTLEFTAPIPLNRFRYYLEKNASCERFDNIAASVQKLVEETVTAWIKAAISKFEINRIYVGGGVFMNVKLNKKIIEMPEVEKVQFMPSCGDESCAIGAAHLLYNQHYGRPEPLENLYLGIQYTNEEVKEYMDKNGIDKKYKVTYHEDMEPVIADLVSKGKIVARFKGKGEWGARALGNRTIIGDPSKMASFYTVNDQIKKRDFWMPFAPSILHEDADKYIKNPKGYEAPFMIVAFDSTKEGQDKLRAAMHQADKTLRPQIVTKEFSPDYHRLISLFKEKTGIGAVLNTSLNLHGYPLVATLKQAFFTFEGSGLKHIAIENYLVEKQ